MREFYTINETAKILKVAPSTIRKYLGNGRLTGAKIDKIWRISDSDIDQFIAVHHSGRPNPNPDGGK